MDRVIFNEDQYCNGNLIHKSNKEYECLDETKEHYIIRQEPVIGSINPCTRFPKSCEGKLFNFVD